jgi:recombinase, phage RecT family
MATLTKATAKKVTFRELCEQPETKAKFNEMLGEKNGVSFLDSAIRMVQNRQDLVDCEPESVLNAVSAIASLDLMIDPSFGQAFIDTYKFKIGLRWFNFAQFQIGYKGLIELGHRTNSFLIIHTDDVRDGEYKSINRMTGEIEFEWNNDQDARKKLPVIGFIAYFQLTAGFRKSMYMTVKEMQDHGKKWSKNFRDKDKGWQKDFDGMGRKTVLKLLLDKYAPKSREMKRAIAFDQAIINDIHGQSLNYIDNPNTKVKVNLEDQNKAVERQRIIDHIENSKTIPRLEQVFEHIPDEEIRELYDQKIIKLTTKKK